MTGSIPRPVLLVLIGAALAGGLFMFTRSGSSDSETPPAPASTTSAPSQVESEAAPSKSGTAGRPDTAKAGEGRAGKSESDLPAGVEKALSAKKAVVLLFWNSRAVDDRSVKESVDGLSRRGGKVAVFTDGVRNLHRYTRISAATAITQTPSIVFVSPSGEAEVQTGYLDSQTIEQYVTNALRR